MAHLLVDGRPVHPETARCVGQFLMAARARLTKARRRLSPADRAGITRVQIETLSGVETQRAGLVFAAYLPIRGEPNQRLRMHQVQIADATVLIPVLAEARSLGCLLEISTKRQT